MYKHFYLKLFYSRWTLYPAAAVITLNLLTAMFFDSGNQAVMSLVNLANLFIVMYLTANYMNIHMLMSYNKNHIFYMALPGNKKDLIKSDYMFHLLMTLLSIVVIFTFSLAHGAFYNLFGMIMITGVNLLIASFYYTTFVQDWFRNINLKVIIFLVPMGSTFMLYYMPLINVTEGGLEMNAMWNFILYVLPYIVLGLGILAYIITYFTNQKKAVKHDII